LNTEGVEITENGANQSSGLRDLYGLCSKQIDGMKDRDGEFRVGLMRARSSDGRGENPRLAPLAPFSDITNRVFSGDFLFVFFSCPFVVLLNVPDEALTGNFVQ
jgi:hypothetical protein